MNVADVEGSHVAGRRRRRWYCFVRKGLKVGHGGLHVDVYRVESVREQGRRCR